MTLKKLLIFLVIIISNIALAEDAVYLNQGDKSPYSGYLLPQDKLIELRNNTFERDELKGENTSLKASISLQDDIISKKDAQMKLYSDQADKLAQTAFKAESETFWSHALYFGLGVLATGLAIEGVRALR